MGRVVRLIILAHKDKYSVGTMMSNRASQKGFNLSNLHNYQMSDGSQGFVENDWHIFYRNCALIIKNSLAPTPSLQRTSRLAPKDIPGRVSAEYRGMAVNEEGILWTDGNNFHITANSSIPCKWYELALSLIDREHIFKTARIKVSFSVSKQWKVNLKLHYNV